MRKLLILMLVLGMASMANAALTLTIGGADAGTEYTLMTTDTIWIGVNTDTAVQFDAVVVIPDDPCSLAGGSWTGGNVLYIPPAKPGSTTNFSPYSPGYGEGWYLAASSPSTVLPQAGLIAEYEFHCDAEGDVMINLLASNWTTVLDTVTIHQIPEPMTMALLGVGALLLRRRK